MKRIIYDMENDTLGLEVRGETLEVWARAEGDVHCFLVFTKDQAMELLAALAGAVGEM